MMLGMAEMPFGTPARAVVLGMHRSGTSAVTRVLNLLGFPVCVDLFEGQHNPAGYWESRSLIDFNDELLHQVGAEWWGPPAGDAWSERLVGSHGATGRSVFEAAHPTDSWVWKDPRTCLTLPFWREVLPPFVAVVVLRNPWAVAESVCRRTSRFDGPDAVVDLWADYMRRVLRGIEGLPAVFVNFDELVAQPEQHVPLLVDHLADVKVLVRLDGMPAAIDSLKSTLAHDPERRRLPRPHRRLRKSLGGMWNDSPFRSFPAVDC